MPVCIEPKNPLHDTSPLHDRVARNPRVLLDRNEVEEVYGLPRRWLELAAHKGAGPPMVKISRRMVRYRASDVEAWLAARTVSTAE